MWRATGRKESFTMILSDQRPESKGPGKPRELSAVEFYMRLVTQGQHVAVTCGRDGAPNVHRQCPAGRDAAAWMAEAIDGLSGAYFTPFGFKAGSVGRSAGRSTSNASTCRAFWFDVEGSADKFERNPGGGYPDQQAALKAVKGFVAATGLKPSMMVFTGSGGLHVYFVVDTELAVEDWKPRARRLVELAGGAGLLVDGPVSTDPARIMRAPGSKHQKAGRLVQAYGVGDDYSLADLDRLIGYTPDQREAPARDDSGKGKRAPTYPTAVNADILGEPVLFSYPKAAEKCAAMAKAAEDGGKATPEPVWFLAVATAAKSVEGPALAHEISRGHRDYSRHETQKRVDLALSSPAGPAGCEAWAAAFGGAAAAPCAGCDVWKARTESSREIYPALRFGAVEAMVEPTHAAGVEPAPASKQADTNDTEDAEAPREAATLVPEWLDRLNSEYALVRVGSKMQVAHFRTPHMSATGVTYGLGFLDLGGFHAKLKGRFVPGQKAGDRPRQLAQAWLEHRQRRQYEGLAFAPGETLPLSMLNLWTGFAVEPQPGDVAPWLDLLESLIPDEVTRSYALCWFAWKLQNPGGVPGTVLILTGPKGSGKNSLAEIVMGAFGSHGMLAADAELIAGRFTIHLMDKAFVVVDEAVFAGDASQQDKLKSRITGTTLSYEGKGMDPVTGVNRAAYVMLTNHSHVWQATVDERRAVVCEVSGSMCGKHDAWARYHAWASGAGPAALLHYLLTFDLKGFNVRAIPRTAALQRQTELTALRDPVVAWWHQVLSEAAVEAGGVRNPLSEAEETEVPASTLRQSYESSAGARGGRFAAPWPVAVKRLSGWLGVDGLRKVRPRSSGAREWRYLLPPLTQLRAFFLDAAGVSVGGDLEQTP